MVAQRLAVAGARRALRRRRRCASSRAPAVAGITRVDEPVGELLDRFEKAAVDDVLAAGAQPAPVISRRQVRNDVTGPLAVVLDAPDVLWAGRTATNPVHRIADPAEWQVNENQQLPHTFHRCAARGGLR